DVTVAQFHHEVVSLAKGLLAAGVQSGDRVGLMSRTRYEWTVLDYAIWWIGAATVPIYETSSIEQAGWILTDAAPVACIVEDADHLARVTTAMASVASLRHVWSMA